MNCSDFGITRYAIGLDVGIASAGWAVVGLDGNDEPCGIVDEGVRVFDKAEAPDTGESLASKRRRARCLRRLIRRNKHRRERLLALLIKFCFITEEEFDNLFNDKLEDIYMLRVRALDERISNLELVRILLNLTKRRGFKSSRKSDRDKLDEMYQAKTGMKLLLWRPKRRILIRRIRLRIKTTIRIKKNGGPRLSITGSV